MCTAVERLKKIAIPTICKVFQVKPEDISQTEILSRGMTNRSLLFSVRGERYIIRIPGEGTDRLIDRVGEQEVYQAISSAGISDEVIYIDAESGEKITRYLEHARTCDPHSDRDVHRCMAFLRAFHGRELQVNRRLDLFEMLEFYEKLRDGRPSVYEDYYSTKACVLSLRPFIQKHVERWTLSHIDAVPTNFLFFHQEQGREELRLIDWEYAGMQDPDVDIAMFAVYALPEKSGLDRLIDAYYPEGCSRAIRVKIHAYAAVCGLLWSNWCEFKRQVGVEFGEYALQQYCCAVDYAKLARHEIGELRDEN